MLRTLRTLRPPTYHFSIVSSTDYNCHDLVFTMTCNCEAMSSMVIFTSVFFSLIHQMIKLKVELMGNYYMESNQIEVEIIILLLLNVWYKILSFVSLNIDFEHVTITYKKNWCVPVHIHVPSSVNVEPLIVEVFYLNPPLITFIIIALGRYWIYVET